MRRIEFLVNEVRGGWEPTDKRLGGTEESIVRWAEELRKRGYLVGVYRNGKHHPDTTTGRLAHHNGVDYSERDSFHNMDDGLGAVCINVKSPEVKPQIPTLYLTNEVNADGLDLSAYDGVIFPSQWCVDNIPVNNKTFVVPHGYDSKKIYPKDKVKKQCLYASSPDRGLETLELIWPSVVEKHPDAHLYVTYGGQINTPNTTCGEFTEEEMNDLFNTSDIWVHPASQGELYCMSGVKAQVAGAIPVYFPIMALQETVKAGEKCTDVRDMYAKLVSLLGDEERKEEYREELSKQRYPTWEDSTDRLLEIIKGVL